MTLEPAWRARDRRRRGGRGRAPRRADHADIDQGIDLSDQAWRSWAQGLRFEGPHQEAVRRSALALKLLVFSPSGAIAAAATTSLPERIGGEKNYNYR